MNPSISMQVGQAAGDIVPVWGRVSSAWVIVIVEVDMIPGQRSLFFVISIYPY